MTALQEALGWALFHFLWQGTAIGAVLAGALWISTRSRTRSLLASLAMAAMVLSFAATLAVCWPANLQAAKIPAAPRPPLRLAPAPPTGRSDLDALRHATPPAWMVPVWTGGVSLFYCYSLLAWLAATRLKRHGAFPAPLEWQHRLTHLAARLGLHRPIALMESCLTDVPVVIGYLRPVILLPLGLLAGLAADQVEAILIHELAHIRRYDYLVNGMQTLVEGMLFYHPAVWWVGSVMRREREHCCDDIVVSQQGDAPAYAATLARLELSRGTVREPALAATGGNLMKRIHRLMRQPEGPRLAAPLISAGVLLATATLGIAAWQSQTPPPTPQVQTPPVPLPADSRPLTPLQQRAREKVLHQELETPYRKWLNEDVAYIITDEERSAFKRLQTDAEREQFIEQFWLRRDPTPGTLVNEFKQEHYRRIIYANDHFAFGIPGWKTDRGRIYITYGPPDEIEDHAATSSTVAFQQWRYKLIPGVGTNVVVEFIDPTGTHEYRMTLDPREKAVPLPLPITVTVLPAPAPAGNSIPTVSEVQPHRVELSMPVDTRGHRAEVRGSIRTPSGHPVANSVDLVEPTANTYTSTFMLVPGSYLARFTVTDQVDGTVYQGEIPLEVR